MSFNREERRGESEIKVEGNGEIEYRYVIKQKENGQRMFALLPSYCQSEGVRG